MGSTELGANSDDYSLSYDKLHHFLSRLEEERLKIDVFKRELPLCMQLLTNGTQLNPQLPSLNYFFLILIFFYHFKIKLNIYFLIHRL